MNLQDYLMSDEDKARLVKQLESDIGFTDETFESDIVPTNNPNDEDSNDLFEYILLCLRMRCRISPNTVS